MRLILKFNLENEKITNQYRNFLMSYFKYALLKEYDDIFTKLYGGEALSKPFSFSVFIKNQKNVGDYIIVPNKKLYMTFSSTDYSFLNLLYNSLLLNKKRKMPIKPHNLIYLDKISLNYLDEVSSSTIKVKLLSPLLIRTKQDNKDIYVTVDDKNFSQYLNDNLMHQASIFNLDNNNLQAYPLSLKKVVIPLMGIRYDASVGTLIIKGTPKTLDTLYKIGIGSRRSEGFGMFEIINE